MLNSKNLRSEPIKIRRSFRVPVTIQDNISVVINNKSYHVFNLSPEGVNIANTDHSPFTIGESIENCNLILSDCHIKNLTASIVHCSCGVDGKWNNGIQWIDLADDDLKRISSTISKVRQRLTQVCDPS